MHRLQKLTLLIHAFLSLVLLNSCKENNSATSQYNQEDNTLFGEYLSLSEFMPSELVVIIKPNGNAAFGMKSQPNDATYTIEDNKLTLKIIDGSQQTFLIDPAKPGILIHEFTEAVFTKNPPKK